MKKKDVTHLHIHSNGSLLDGLIKITSSKENPRKELVDRIKEMGMTSVGLTDHGNLSRAIELYTTCHENKILPIIGTEFYIIDGDTTIREDLENKKTHHLTVLAKNTAGYQNLIKLNTYAAMHYQRKPKIDYNVLIQHKEGLIVLSGCPSSQIYYSIMNQDWVTANRITELLKNAFGEDFYMEIQQNNLTIPNDKGCSCCQKDMNEAIIKIGRDYNVKACPTGDAHYLYKDDSRAHEIALAIATGSTLDVPTRQEAAEIQECAGAPTRYRMKFDDFEYYVKSREELSVNFTDKQLDVTLEIKEKCAEKPVEINMPGKKFAIFSQSNMKHEYLTPKFDVEDSTKFLEELCYKGLKKITDRILNKQEYEERLVYELNVIKKMKFEDYFLIVWDIMNYARRNGIAVGCGRGSSGGSLLCYCLKITEVDSIAYNLLFSRFLNEERISMPDIDIDVSSSRRDEIFRYIETKYGQDKVARIGTYIMSKGKLIANDVFRVYANSPDLRLEDGTEYLPTMITEHIEADAGFSETLSDISEKKAFKENVLPIIEKNKTLNEMFEIMKKLENNPKSLGRHACLTGDSKLLTIDGYRTFKELEGKWIRIINNHGIRNAIIKKTGNKQSYELSYSYSKYSSQKTVIKLTEDHRVLTPRGYLEAKDAIGENLIKVLNQYPALLSLIGWFWNDGNFDFVHNDYRIYLTPDKDNEARSLFSEYIYQRKQDRKDKFVIKKECMINIEKDYGSGFKKRTYEKGIPVFHHNFDITAKLAFLQGFMSANASIQRNQIRLKLTSKPMVSFIKNLLSEFGIESTELTKNTGKNIKFNNGTYQCKDSWAIQVNKIDSYKFVNLIGFIQSYKNDKIKPPTFQSIEKSKIEDVYDFTVETFSGEEGHGYVDGIIVHNCGQIISSRPLNLDVPLMRVDTKKKDEDGNKIIEYITQYEMEDIEACGLIKVDILSLETLDLVQECLKQIKIRHNTEIDLLSIPVNDGDVFDFLTHSSAYEGLFQMSNPGYVKMIRSMKPDCIENIMDGMALK